MDTIKKTRIAFQGEHGAFSEMAAYAALGEDIISVPCRTFDAVYEGVDSGQFELGIVPIENTLAGSIHRNYDLLLRHELLIIGETQLRIQHCLIVNPGTQLEDIKIVRSHPQALAQCEHTLRELGVQTESASDTAGSVRALRESGARDAAAIASRLAAEVYGMEVLVEELEDNQENYTRFILLGCAAAEPAEENKTSIVFSLRNEPGGLFRALACFALRDIDLTKIESRPYPGSAWKYRFYLDFIGGQHEEKCQRALGHLEEIAKELRVLGTYPRRV